MDPWDLTDTGRDLVAAARGFAPEAAKIAAAADEARAPDPSLIPKAAELGLTGMQVPPEHGGAGLAYSARAAVAEALGAVCYGVAMSVINSHNCALRVARFAPAETAERLAGPLARGEIVGCTAMSEPNAGSDFAALATTAARDGDGWRLTGEKAWICNAPLADVAVVFAQTAEPGDAKGVGGFLVETSRPGVRATGPALAGLHAMGLGGFALDGYAAPSDALLLPPGPGFRRAMEDVNGARVHVAAMACGMLRAALDAARAHGAHRRTFGRPLAGHQGWRWVPAQAEADLFAACLSAAEAARRIDAGVDAQFAAASAKLIATEAASRHVPALVHALGSEGLAEGSPLARHLLGARAARLADGSTEMLLERIARLTATPF
ncbi:MAG: acyl-CoA dehydrogenase family protein [Pseudomonadota bacterium]